MSRNAWEGMWKELFVADVRRLVEDSIRVFVRRDVQSTVTLSQGSQCLCLDWNQEPPKYKPLCSVRMKGLWHHILTEFYGLVLSQPQENLFSTAFNSHQFKMSSDRVQIQICVA
jgi:hypothetical protein